MQPNVVFILTDEWRAQALGYAGDPNVQTPHLDALAAESWRFDHAVANVPVCCPMRATLMTGLLPDRHGVFTNDVHLDQRFVSMADGFNQHGYRTGWIGKWHIDGHGRQAYIPPERRQRFHYFEACECCHNYNNSRYYLNDDPTLRTYQGYDAFAQTESALRFISQHEEKTTQPYFLALSLGPPHFPLHSAPEEFRSMYDPQTVELRPNVDENCPGDEKSLREDVAGYYAHCSAVDAAVGRLLAGLAATRGADNTLVIFTSDHGDMLYSHGAIHKQKPYDESILVPLLIRPPAAWDAAPQHFHQSIGLLDLLPTMNGLCGVTNAQQFQGNDYSADLRRGLLPEKSHFIAGYGCFGEYTRARGGREWRGFRSQRYTYVQDLQGPWLLFDNERDPYQQHNLVAEDSSEIRELLQQSQQQLRHFLDHYQDEFAEESVYLKRWGWPVNDQGTVPFGKTSGVGISPRGCPTLGISGLPDAIDGEGTC